LPAEGLQRNRGSATFFQRKGADLDGPLARRDRALRHVNISDWLCNIHADSLSPTVEDKGSRNEKVLFFVKRLMIAQPAPRTRSNVKKVRLLSFL
jgi:hypothetical protein